jgi:hypothetical protein
MPEKATTERARKDEQEGKSPSTQAGEFVREEMIIFAKESTALDHLASDCDRPFESASCRCQVATSQDWNSLSPGASTGKA